MRNRPSSGSSVLVRKNVARNRPLAISTPNPLARNALQTEEITQSETVRSMMGELHAKLVEALQASIAAVEENDPRKAQDVRGIKAEFERTVELALRHQATRLALEDTARLAGFRFEMEVLDKRQRIYRRARRIAKAVLPAEVLIERAE